MPSVFIIMGDGSKRKSALIRVLSGARNRGIYEIEETSSNKHQFFIQIRSLQEANISPQSFISEIQAENAQHVLLALRINRLNGQPDGLNYINAFQNAGWNISGIVMMGANATTGLPAAPSTIMNNPTSRAANEMANVVRQAWGWK